MSTYGQIDHADWPEKLSDAKRYARSSPRGVAWLVTWPDGHTTVETSPVLMKCNRTKVVEVSASGQLTCA